MEEITKELSKIFAPTPTPRRGETPEEYSGRYKAANEQRRAFVGQLILSARSSELDDPVLARLIELSAQKEDIQQQIRLLIAYGREFVRPVPYRLKSLADAANLSISGTRGIYTSIDVASIATRIGRKNNKGTIFPDSPTSPLDFNLMPPPPDFEGEHWWAVPHHQPSGLEEDDEQEPSTS